MGRRKQVRPHRSVGLHERSNFDAKLNVQNGTTVGKQVEVVVDKPFLVEIDGSSWSADEHFDISEIILSDLEVTEGFCGHTLNEEFYHSSRYFLRFRLSNVNEYLDRIKLGHWPVLAADSICLQFMEKRMEEGIERDVVIVSGKFDGPDEGISGLVHLVSLKLLTLRPIVGFMVLEHMSHVRVRVEIRKCAFEACDSLLDNTRPLWKKSLMSVMAWLRPEVLTSETRYGCRVAAENDIDFPKSTSLASKQARFDVSGFYEAIKPSKQEPVLEDHLPELLPELRPYQRRAAYWMVQREKGASEGSRGNDPNLFDSPLSLPVSFVDTSSKMYYNPFGGNISLQAEHLSLDIPGGILADEMGLGKTVELLACILAHRMPSVEVGKNIMGVTENQENNMRRLRKERIECICGAVSENSKYQGLWVQCDICDAWQHADCVGYSAKRRASRSRDVYEEEENSKKRSKRKNNVKIVEMDGMHICKFCSELIQATESPVATGATLIVCPTPILAQWHAEVIRYSFNSFSLSFFQVMERFNRY